jgi:hypothetical protein
MNHVLLEVQMKLYLCVDEVPDEEMRDVLHVMRHVPGLRAAINEVQRLTYGCAHTRNCVQANVYLCC